MKYFTLIIFSLISFIAVSQPCGSKAEITDTLYTLHYGRPALLLEIDSLLEVYQTDLNGTNLRTNLSRRIDNGVPFNIPIKVWIYNREEPLSPSPKMSEYSVKQKIKDLNTLFSPLGIRFYLKCKVENIYDNRFWSVTSEGQDNLMKQTYHDETALNMHVPNNADYGYGEFPWYSLNASFSIASTNLYHIAHEIGHTLGLYHTFESRRGGTDNGDEGNCFQESVSRTRSQGALCLSTIGLKKCDVNGDGFCDTDADYKASDDYSIGTSCGYSGTKQDNWGVEFIPPTKNIMSYWWYCRSEFTQSQGSAMALYLSLPPILGHEYFTYNGSSFLNLNAIAISGSVYYGESEEYQIPETIETDNPLTVYSGGSLELKSLGNIRFKNGFHSKAGSHLSAKIDDIDDCDIQHLFNSQTSSLKVAKTVNYYTSDFQKELSQVVDKHLKSKEASPKDISNGGTKFNIYPSILSQNDILNIVYQMSENEYIYEITIYSLHGSKLVTLPLNRTNNGSISIPIEQKLPIGTYILNIKTNTDVHPFKIIIH